MLWGLCLSLSFPPTPPPFQKIRPDNEIPEVREKLNSEVPSAAVTVTNNSDLNDSREINFEYLKHVVLKFMSCREAEVKTLPSFPFAFDESPHPQHTSTCTR